MRLDRNVATGLLSLAIAWLATASAFGQSRDLHGEAPLKPVIAHAQLQFAGQTDAGDMRLAIDASSIQRMNESAGATVRLAISPTESVMLNLARFEAIAPGARFVRASGKVRQELATPDVVFLRGSIAGEPNSRAFLALSVRNANLGLGMITRDSGERLNIGTDRTGAQPALALRRGDGLVPEFDHFCSMIPLDAGGDEGGLAGIPLSPSAGPRVLNVAVDSDQRFWQLFNDDEAAIEYVAMVMAAVSDIYIRDLDLRVAVRMVRIWPDGGEPFSPHNLSAFRTWWRDNEDLDGLNFVHMFSGARDTSYGGVAYLTNACTQNGFGISAFLLGGFQSPVGAPHLGNWDVVVVAHEIGHNLGTPHTHDLNPPIDTCAQGSDERGTIMSYCHVRPGGLLNTDMHMHTRIAGIIRNANPVTVENCLWRDCNGNLINDVEDIVFGSSADLNEDGIPDECQDCNNNGILDPLDIALTNSQDINGNGIPDECEIDCNGNGIPDAWECAEGLAADVNGNAIPDECEPDCDNNGVADFLDIALGTHTDVDRNSVPDICDDCNANGVADWIDLGRQFNIFIGQVDNQIADPLREYHASSGVAVAGYDSSFILDAPDLVFGPDRQLYVISAGDTRVVRVNVDTASMTTFVTSADAGFAELSSLAFDADGRLYTASNVNSAIRRYSVNGEFESIFADLAGPIVWDLAFGPNGNLFALTSANGVIEINAANGAVIGTFASSANLDQPRGMCFMPNGDLLVANFQGNSVRRFSSTGVDLGQWNDEYPMTNPWGIVVGPNGNVFAARRGGPARIIEYSPQGRYLRSFIRGDDALTHPTAMAIRPASPADANGNGILDVCENTCPADIAPQPAGDGVVNVSDLLAVISAWGVCQGSPCVADIAPAGIGDGVVNVSDLLMVISSWGPCQ